MFCDVPIESSTTFQQLLKKTTSGHFGIPFKLDEIFFQQLPKEFTYDSGMLYFTRFFELKKKLLELVLIRKKGSIEKIDLYGEIDPRLNLEQKGATVDIFSETTILLQGGPGSGKTFTISRMIPLFIRSFEKKYQKEPKILLAAQTAKAVHHLAKQVDKEFKSLIRVETLHRALKIKKQIGETSPTVIDEDLVIIDESSMIDAAMMNLLLSSLEPSSRLILIGDPYQLPPIEGGAPFKFMIENKSFCHHFLPGSHRAENRQIIDEANGVFQNIIPKTLDLKTFDPLVVSERFVQPVNELPKDLFSNHYKILSSLRIGPYGSVEISKKIFEQLKQKPGRYLLVPIMITKNQEKMELFNGQEGTYVYDKQSRHHYVFFPHLEKPVPAAILPAHEISYAISIHKSQGSEYDYVDILLPESKETLLKEHLYTAMTRAKKGLRIYELNSIKSIFEI